MILAILALARVVIYDCNDNGPYYKTMILANLDLARVVIYDFKIVKYHCKEHYKLVPILQW